MQIYVDIYINNYETSGSHFTFTYTRDTEELHFLSNVLKGSLADDKLPNGIEGRLSHATATLLIKYYQQGINLKLFFILHLVSYELVF